MRTITGKFHQNPLKTVGGVAETRLNMTSIKYAHLQVMRTITGKFHQNPLKTVGGVAETRRTAEKLLMGHNSGKNQSSMTSIKYAHLQVMGTITGKFH